MIPTALTPAGVRTLQAPESYISQEDILPGHYASNQESQPQHWRPVRRGLWNHKNRIHLTAPVELVLSRPGARR